MNVLDWDKAFDRMQHDGMALAFKRLCIHPHFADVIMGRYSPRFCVEDDYCKSATMPQESGIRQGCSWSSYLFVLIMPVIDS